MWDIDMGLDVWLDRDGVMERERAVCESPEAEAPPPLSDAGDPARPHWQLTWPGFAPVILLSGFMRIGAGYSEWRAPTT